MHKTENNQTSRDSIQKSENDRNAETRSVIIENGALMIHAMSERLMDDLEAVTDCALLKPDGHVWEQADVNDLCSTLCKFMEMLRIFGLSVQCFAKVITDYEGGTCGHHINGEEGKQVSE